MSLKGINHGTPLFVCAQTHWEAPRQPAKPGAKTPTPSTPPVTSTYRTGKNRRIPKTPQNPPSKKQMGFSPEKTRKPHRTHTESDTPEKQLRRNTEKVKL
jgi:hypothetical protein